MATGVLVVAVGRATRLIEYVTEVAKAYVAEITLGVETDTYDTEGTVLARSDPSAITRDAVDAALTPFRGAIQQRAPAHSAISVGGKRLYELARAGKVVEAPLRAVEITTLELRDWQSPTATVFIECSKGTYVRSLAHDLGVALGAGGHLSALRRLRVGRYRVEDATPLDVLEAHLRDSTWESVAVALDTAVAHVPPLLLDEANVARLQHGQNVPLPDEAVAAVGTLCRALGTDGRLVAMARVIEQNGQRLIHPEKVLASAG